MFGYPDRNQYIFFAFVGHAAVIDRELVGHGGGKNTKLSAVQFDGTDVARIHQKAPVQNIAKGIDIVCAIHFGKVAHMPFDAQIT